MKCNYKLQCPNCQCIFDVEVDTSTDKTYYPASCPECKKKIKITLVQEDKLHSLPSSKTIPLKEKSLVEKTSGDKIIFKCVRRVPHIEQESRIIRQKQSKPPDGAPTIPISVEPITRPEPHPTTGLSVVAPGHRGYARTRQRRKKRTVGAVKGSTYRHRAPHKRIYQEPWAPTYYPRQSNEGFKFGRIFREPEKRLNLAIILLIIVFFLGITHGIISLHWGTPEHITPSHTTSGIVNIDGTVIDFHTGRPIPNCVVRIVETGQEDLTNDDGYYLIQGVEVGNQEILANAEGYAKISKKVTVASEQPANFNFELKPGVNVETVDETVRTIKKEENTINIFAVIIILLACFALLAIVLIRLRNMFKICVLSAFLSILSFGAGIGLVVGLVALILILFSGSGFNKINNVTNKSSPQKK